MKNGLMCVIDDEPDVLDGLTYLLKPLGTVRPFSSPQEALKEFELGYQPDVTIVDLKMPKMNGLEFIHRCKSLNQGGSIVLSSGNANRNDLSAALNAGVSGFLEKPYSGEQLRSQIETLLEQRLRSADLQVELLGALAETYWERIVLVEEAAFSATNKVFPNSHQTRSYLELKKQERKLLVALSGFNKAS